MVHNKIGTWKKLIHQLVNKKQSDVLEMFHKINWQTKYACYLGNCAMMLRV